MLKCRSILQSQWYLILRKSGDSLLMIYKDYSLDAR